MKNYQINYLYTNETARVLRDSLVVEAKDEATARTTADAILRGRHKVFKITAISLFA